MNIKKVAFVIHSLQAGGMERVMSELVNYFAQKNEYEVHLILYGIKPELFYSVSERVICHRPNFVFDNRYRTWYTLKTMLFLRQILKKIQPVSILSFGERWNNLVLMSTLGTGLAVFVSDRSQPDKPLGFKDDLLRKWLYPKAKGVVVQTQKALAIYQQMYRQDNFKVIGNPIRAIQQPATQRENEILMVGRLIQSKQQDHLIQIFAQLNAPDWKLVLVGYDHLKQENQKRWEALAQELGVGSRVVFAGKRDDVETFYSQAKVFAFTSRSEGFPNVIGEAMASGLPVIAYDCVAGPSDLIKDSENGFLIRLNDQSAFRDQLQKLIDQPNLRETISIAAQNDIKRFDLKYICNQFETFIIPND